MTKYEDLTKEQKELCDKLETAIEKQEDISSIIRDVPKDDLQKIFTTASITKESKDGTKYNLTLLAYAMGFKDFGKTIKVILDESKDKKEVLTTANITTEFPDSTKCTTTLLAYVMNFKDFEKKIKVILDESEDKKEVLTTANITTELSDGTKYNLTPLAYVMGCEDFEKKIKVILDESKDKKEVLTANITKESSDGTKCNLTLLNYAMYFHGASIAKFIVSETSEYFDGVSIAKFIVNETSENIAKKDTVKTTNKSIMIGSVCGVIAALAVSSGCFAAGVALPISTLIGIAVAAALVIGVIAGVITYSVLKLDEPSLEPVNQQKKEI